LGNKALTTLRQEAGLAPVSVSTRTAVVQTKKQMVAPMQLAVPPAQRRGPKVGSRLAPWLLLLGLCLILSSASVFVSRYNALETQNEALASDNHTLSQNNLKLNNDYQILQSDHAQLNLQYNDLSGQFNNLNGRYTALTGEYNKLNDDYSLLSQNYDSLYRQHMDLTDQYNSLSGEYNWLDQIAVKPPYIIVHDRLVDTTFYDTDGQLITWRTPFAGLEYGIEHGMQMRKWIVDDEWQTVLAYNRDGDPLWLRDFSVFVTPDVFEKVVPPLYEKSTSSYDFLYRIWYMIGQLSHYATEDVETPRYSLETLLAGGGDCEDLSILYASLIRAAPVDWYVDLLYVDSEHQFNPQSADHVVVYIDTGQETYLVETTNNEVMLPYTDGISGWLASDLQEGSSPVYLH
jgi:hypothetical protein